ncbi:MFS transporter [Agaricicola taiwanensis]|uniref:MFS transporter n=1 Tax=Agaricicola taiwanensis TaxID=591372 RepID=A0A8J3E0N5_9RHOB|nr:tripartite tricarboxylate transporter substrate-binding protein [Agaricicola taiwanensis]GGE51655.1 MFS transporter [Agaricicola taiwanensis]
MKRTVGLFLGLGAALLSLAPAAQGSEFPTRPVTLIVGYAPGGGTDLVARNVAEVLSRKWGQKVLVENRPGATGSIGIRALKNAAPDGYTLAVWTDSDVGNSAVQDNLGYDLVEDFDHISQLSAGSTILVSNPSVPIKTFGDYVDYAKKNPGELNFAVVTGGGMHLDSLRINAAAGVETAIIGYPGSGPALTDVIAGHADALLLPLGPALPHVKGGALQALAIGGTKRWPGLSDVQTLSETVPGLESTFFHGLVGPKGLPDDLKASINAAVQDALADPKLGAQFEAQGFIPSGNSPEEFKAVIAEKLETSRTAAVKTGLKKQ